MGIVSWEPMEWVSGAALQVTSLWRAPLQGDGLQLEDVSITLLSVHLSAAFFRLLPSPPGQVILPHYSMPSEPMATQLPLCWLPGCRVPWPPHFQPLLSPLRGGGGGAVFLAAGELPPRLGCLVPWVSSTTAGLQLAPRALQLPAMFVSHTGAARAVSWLVNTAT